MVWTLGCPDLIEEFSNLDFHLFGLRRQLSCRSRYLFRNRTGFLRSLRHASDVRRNFLRAGGRFGNVAGNFLGGCALLFHRCRIACLTNFALHGVLPNPLRRG